MFKITLSCLLFLLIGTSYTKAQNLDINILREINLSRNKALDPTFEFVSNTTEGICIAAPICIYTIGMIKEDKKIKNKGLYVAESYLISAIITEGLKNSIKRSRPFETYPYLEKESVGGSYSFPSGHTSAAFSTATSLTLAFKKWYVAVPSFLWASTVAYSRMSLGVHYPSDVLAGAIVGSGSALLSNKINKWINAKKKHT